VFDTNFIEIENIEIDEYFLSQLVLNNPIIKQEIEKLDVINYDLKINRKIIYPKISLNININTNFSSILNQISMQTYLNSLYNNIGNGAFIGLNFPILNQNQNKLAKRTLLIEKEKQENIISASKENLYSELNSFVESIKELKYQKKTVNNLLINQLKIYNNKSIMYNYDRITTSELIISIQQINSLKNQQIDLQYLLNKQIMIFKLYNYA